MTTYIAWIGQGDNCVVETCEASDDAAAINTFERIENDMDAESAAALGDDFDVDRFGAIVMHIVALSDDPK